jgi:16S rRNA (uracil1498-N3)-methyltransferase
MEWAIEKCTELGVARFIPLIAARTDSKLASAAQKRVERWQRIAREAAEQSRRPSLPEIAEPIKSKAAVSLPAATRIILSETEQTQALSKVLLSNSPNDDVMVAIGPEGGWTSDEDHLFRKAGWIAASLGPTILRAETASIAAIAIMMSKMA